MLDMTRRAQTNPPAVAAHAACGAARRIASSSGRVGPQRTCSGCRAAAAQTELIRVVLGPDGSAIVDLGRQLPGRGAWVHPTVSCLESAVAKGFARSLRAPIKSTAEEVFAALRQSADRRVAGLLSSAWRAKQAAIGSTAVKECLERDEALLLVVAVDARAALATPGVEVAIAAGRAVAWGDRVILGRTVGRNEVGVLAIRDRGLAHALAAMIRIAHLGEKHSDVDRAGGYPFREV